MRGMIKMLNNRGFAITGVMYTLLLLFLVLLLGMLVVLGSRKIILDNYKVKIQERLDNPPSHENYVQEGLVLWYDTIINADQISTGLAMENEIVDLSGNNNHGVLINFDFENDGWQEDRLVFNGVNSYVETGFLASTFDSSADFSLEMYFILNEVTANGDPTANASVLLGNFENNGYGINWATYGDDETKYHLIAGASDNVGSNFIEGYEVSNFAKKYHVVMAYSSMYEVINFYVNGVLVAQTDDLSGIMNASGNLGIGLNQSFDNNFATSYSSLELFSVKIYNRAIAVNEVIRNYAIDNARYNKNIDPEFIPPQLLPDNEHIMYINDPEDENYPEHATPCEIDGNEFTHILDKRDDAVYAVTKIGEQCWMAENLSYTGNGCLTNEWGYGEACRSHGPNEGDNQGSYMSGIVEEVLYQWNAAMAGDSTEGASGLCPENWYIPSHDDWTDLEREICNLLNNSNCSTEFPKDTSTSTILGLDEGEGLKDDNHWDGTNIAGFGALPAGKIIENSWLDSVGFLGNWWSSTSSNGTAWGRYIFSDVDGIGRHQLEKEYGNSVRCILDQ